VLIVDTFFTLMSKLGKWDAGDSVCLFFKNNKFGKICDTRTE
jgi:hypothetical protein